MSKCSKKLQDYFTVKAFKHVLSFKHAFKIIPIQKTLKHMHNFKQAFKCFAEAVPYLASVDKL